MSKDQNLKQMSLLGDSHANQLALQENKKVKMMIDTYSQKCLKSLKRLNPDGLLVKMCKTLLTSQMEQSSKKLLKGWKPKISKSNVLVFQLVHKVLGIKEKESGLLPTPTTDSVSERTKKYKQGGTPLTMAVRQMYPTPNATNINTPQPTRVEQVSSGGFILRKKNKPHMTYGARLQDVMHHLDKNPGGTLNPEFVEFLMGYPKGWTDLEKTESKHLETQSYPKSQEKSEKQSLKQKMYRTPTAMDKGDNSFKYAAKILKGKLNRSESKQPVQKTLSMDVAMEHLKDNQHLINEYDEKFKTRPHLPPKDIFLKYLKENLDKKKLIENNIIKKTTIDHWLRSDHCFAYPTVEYWNMIKPYLKEIKFDKEMTTEIESDWE